MFYSKLIFNYKKISPMTSKKISALNGAVLLVNCMLGAGIVGLPKSFAHLGSIGGSVVLLGVAFITFLSLYYLIAAVDKTGHESYSNLCLGIGNWASKTLNWMIVLNCYGCTFTYVLFMVEFTSKLLETYTNIPSNLFTKMSVTFAFLLPLYFLSNMKSIDKLKFTAMIVIFAIFYISILFFFFFFTVKTYGDKKDAFVFNNNLAKGVPSFLFAMGCQQSSVSIYNSLEDKSMSNALLSMGMGCVLGFLVYWVVGSLGYTVLGNFSEPDFLAVFCQKSKPGNFVHATLNGAYDKYNIKMTAAVVAFVLILVGAFPIQTFIGRSSLIDALVSKKNSNGASRKVSLVSNLVHFLLLIASVAFNIKPGKVLGLIGSSVTPAIAFLFPSFIYIWYCNKKNLIYFSACVMLLFSLGLIVYCTVDSILDFVR